MFHNTALYELLYLLVAVRRALAAAASAAPPIVPGTVIGDLLHRATRRSASCSTSCASTTSSSPGSPAPSGRASPRSRIGMWILVYWRPRNARLVEAETEQISELRAAEIDALGSETGRRGTDPSRRTYSGRRFTIVATAR